MSSKYPVPDHVLAGTQAPISSIESYRDIWSQAHEDRDGFWLATTQQFIHWQTPPTRGLEGSYDNVADAPLQWFSDGVLNVTESCIDRHLETRGDQVALLWEGDEPGDVRRVTYRELHQMVCKTGNALQSMGVTAGDRVIIYMGMVVEAAVAMLACARIGAVHSVVFGGFSAEALRSRIEDCQAEVVITQDEGRRGGRTIPLKRTTDEAVSGVDCVKKVLVYRRTGGPVDFEPQRDVWWHQAVEQASAECPAQGFPAEHPLFILYTSGSTGRPKGVVHTCGGYLTYTSYTHQTVFDIRPGDVYACVADVGWITGHSYIVYGPLANGTTSLMFESTPLYPDAGRYWDMVARHGINVFYTAPTAIRALAAHGAEPVQRYDRSTLRVLGTVGEPINPAAWEWYYEVVGDERCTIVDTWWQTETGGMCISPIASATPTKPGSATLPLPGIVPALIDPNTNAPLEGPGEGHLCLSQPWPGQARTVYGDHPRYVETYFSAYPGLYFTGDGCRRDTDGYYWITGRIDDVLNVAGHRMGTAEFESALVSDARVAEAAVVGFPHELKGQGVYAYIVMQPDEEVTDTVSDGLNRAVRTTIGAHAKVDRFQFVPGLPKTRSGKVMRRILRKVAHGEAEQLGDVSTLADPSVVDAIIAGAST